MSVPHSPRTLSLIACLALGPVACSGSGDDEGSAEPGKGDDTDESPGEPGREFPVNPEISPCDDFYEHACSIAASQFELPPGESTWTFSLNDANQRIEELRRAFLDGLPEQGVTERQAVLRDHWRACLSNTGDAGAAMEVESLRRAVARAEAITDWPVGFGRQALERRSGVIEWFTIPANDMPTRSAFLAVPRIAFNIVPVITDPDGNVVAGTFGNPAFDSQYRAAVGLFFEGLFPGDANNAARADAAVAYDQAAAATFPPLESLRELFFTTPTRPVSEVRAKYPNLGIPTFLAGAPDEARFLDAFGEISETADAFLAGASVLERQAIYLWTEHHFTARLSNPAYATAMKQLRVDFLGEADDDQPLAEECLHEVGGHAFGRILDREVYDASFEPFEANGLIELAEDLRARLEADVVGSFLSDAAKQVAVDKAAKLRLQIGVPEADDLWSFEALPAEPLDPDDWFGNLDKVNAALVADTFARLTVDKDPAVWLLSPLTPNAFYNPSANTFAATLGFLTPPVWDPAAPTAQNLGAIGAVIGHELGHAFDPTGSNFDGDGVLRPWFSEADLAEYEVRTRQLLAPFAAAYAVDFPDHDVDTLALQHLGENIADAEGLRLAYAAAFEGVASPSRADRQAFFLQYARTWCGVFDPDAVAANFSFDPHAPNKYRTNVQLQQMPEFAEAFECAAGSPMTSDTSYQPIFTPAE